MELLEYVHEREVPFDTEGIWNSFCFAGEPAGSQAGSGKEDCMYIMFVQKMVHLNFQL